MHASCPFIHSVIPLPSVTTTSRLIYKPFSINILTNDLPPHLCSCIIGAIPPVRDLGMRCFLNNLPSQLCQIQGPQGKMQWLYLFKFLLPCLLYSNTCPPLLINLPTTMINCHNNLCLDVPNPPRNLGVYIHSSEFLQALESFFSLCTLIPNKVLVPPGRNSQATDTKCGRTK